MLDEIKNILESYRILILSLGATFYTLYQFYKYLEVVRLKKNAKDLHPFWSYEEITPYTKYYIPTKYQTSPPSDKEEQRFAEAPKSKLLDLFLKKAFKAESNDRFYLIMADSGMGKTTLMINLYFSYLNQWWFNRKYNIKLIPLGHRFTNDEIDKLSKSESLNNTIVLLDALDEDFEALNYEKRIDELVEKLGRCRLLIISCRTQFFPNEQKEPFRLNIRKIGSNNGFHEFQKLYLSPFDDKDIKNYLHKKFKWFKFWNWKKKDKAFNLVKKSPNLMIRPMLLSWIDDLLDSNKTFEFSFEVYEELINKWIQREANRQKNDIEREHYKEELYKFSMVMAIELYNSWHNQEMSAFVIHPDKITPIAIKHQIILDDIDMKSRSLLNRNSEGYYKFSHKSILEYFLTKELFKDEYFFKNFIFEGMSNTKLFYEEKLIVILKSIEGEFKSKNGRFAPIHKLTHQDFKTMEYLKVIGYTQIANLIHLQSLSSLNEITISEREKDYYILYLLYWFQNWFQNKAMKSYESIRVTNIPIPITTLLQIIDFFKLKDQTLLDMQYAKELHILIKMKVSSIHEKITLLNNDRINDRGSTLKEKFLLGEDIRALHNFRAQDLLRLLELPSHLKNLISDNSNNLFKKNKTLIENTKLLYNLDIFGILTVLEDFVYLPKRLKEVSQYNENDVNNLLTQIDFRYTSYTSDKSFIIDFKYMLDKPFLEYLSNNQDRYRYIDINHSLIRTEELLKNIFYLREKLPNCKIYF